VTRRVIVLYCAFEMLSESFQLRRFVGSWDVRGKAEGYGVVVFADIARRTVAVTNSGSRCRECRCC